MATADSVSSEARVYDRPKRLRGSGTVAKASYSGAAGGAVLVAGSLLR
jgi:hypothetical protein